MKKEAKHFQLSSLPFDITCHPTEDLVAVSNIDGEIIFLRCNSDESGVISAVDTTKHHTDSCRRVIFSDSNLLSISSDKTFVQCDVASKRVVRRLHNEHPLYALCHIRDGNIFATGDDEGTIKVWDMRKGDDEALIMKQPEHDNFISSLTVDDTGSTLLAASGDGRLSVWNSRQRKLIARSDECDAELLTCDVVHGGGKVVCGDDAGILNVYSWGDWGDVSDRAVVQEDVSIDVVLQYSDDVLVMGCMDGVIRATSLFPHTPLSHLGDHADNGIEGLCLSPGQTDILSVGHDSVVRAWSVEGLEVSKEDESEEEESDEEEKPRKKKKLKHITSNQVKSKQSAEFFSDLA